MRAKHKRKLGDIFFGILGLLMLWAGVAHGAGRSPDMHRVEIRDGWFYVDGERFFVKGICFFENHLVDGKFERSSPDVIDQEFRRIKEAGFNTIRSQLTSQELQLAEKHGVRACYHTTDSTARVENAGDNQADAMGICERGFKNE